MMKLEEFDRMAVEFLQPMDDETQNEYYMSDWRHASDVIAMLRKHLYQADFEREARYEMYLKLRAEFSPD